MTDTSSISVAGPAVTLMNIFTVAEVRQGELIEALDKGMAEIFAHQPGFVSANIHASLDRTRVVNYMQWATQEDFEAMQCRRDVQDYMQQIITIASSADPRLYTVRAVYHA
jgi:heme-degrading monooxygenase HmoA